MKQNKKWLDNSIQFPRLIAEIQATGGFDDNTIVMSVAEEMDLETYEVHELIDRACDEWDKIKRNL